MIKGCHRYSLRNRQTTRREETAGRGREIGDEQRRHNVEQSINCVCPLSKCKDSHEERDGTQTWKYQ